jgi:hypothetical protein
VRFRATAFVAVLAVFLVVLTGCGGKKKSDTRTTTTRFPPTVPVNNEQLVQGTGVCGYLTPAEVQTATTLQSQPGTGTRVSGSEACRWTLRGTNQFVALTVSGGGAAQFDRSRELFSGGEALTGAGDRAFAANDTVYAQKGDKVLILQVFTSQNVPQRKQAAINLLKIAAPRA